MATAEDILAQIRSRRIAVSRELIGQRLLALADRYLPRFRNTFLSAVRMGRNVPLSKIEAALRTREVSAVQQVIPWASEAVPALEVTMPSVIRDLSAAAARTAERLLPGSLTAAFDITSPLAVASAREHGAELVRQVSEETQKAIQNIIARAIQDGRPPESSARAIRETVGLTEVQEGAVAKLQEAGASERELTRARSTRLRDRSETIAHTETLWAANEGQRLLWQQMAENRLIDHGIARREFIVTPDDHLCPICKPLDGKEYGIGEQIVTELGAVDSPPIHPNCRCTMALVVS